MDAHALLTSQGWRGKGHSLHPTSDTTGLSRPLLVSQKQNNLGVGKKQHNTSDMWWLNAFDKSLQGLDTSEQGKVVQTITSGGLDMVAKGGRKWVGSSGGLYATFVRGEGLGGTITPDTTEGSGSEDPVRKRRRRDGRGEEKEERRRRKAEKRAARLQATTEDIPDSNTRSDKRESPERDMGVDTEANGSTAMTSNKSKSLELCQNSEIKEDRKLRHPEKASKLQIPTVQEDEESLEIEGSPEKRPETKEERRARRAAKKISGVHVSAAEIKEDQMHTDELPRDSETKEERRERKRQKKMLKEASQKAIGQSESLKSQQKKRRKV